MNIYEVLRDAKNVNKIRNKIRNNQKISDVVGSVFR